MIQPVFRWKVRGAPDLDQVRAFARALKVPESLAVLLLQRGIASTAQAKDFLKPSLESFSDPFSLRDMDVATALIGGAVRAGETILVHGDYDVDGQCAAALLTRVLRAAGANVVPFVPHRLRDGYDFGPAGVAAARAAKASLVVTCDCGVTALDTVSQAKAAGLKVVVTDHHLPGALPPADAVIDPARPDCPSPSKELCGTGVAFKLAQALVNELKLPANLPLHFLDLVALATVADIVPLVGENRLLVRHGLRMLADSRWAGARALIRRTGLEGKPLRAGQVSFVLAPRLNAAGRVADAMSGVRLLLSDGDAEADELARELDALNSQRQSLDQAILEEAEAEIEATVDLGQDYGLVLAKEGWHPGVIGIVASRIVERYARPTILIGLDGDEGKGSGRSIPGFDLHQALSRCATHLSRWGGHRMAAGLTVRREQLETFRRAFNRAAHMELTADDLIPTQKVDAVVALQDMGAELERLLRFLEPCGPGNPTPVFGVERAYARNARAVGHNHLRFTLEDEHARLSAIGFDWADRVGDGWWKEPIDVAFRLERNVWRGQDELQARVVQIKAAG